MHFHFWASFKPIFENHVFRALSEPFHPLYEAKISNRSLSVVYGSITLKFFRGLWELVPTSGSTAEKIFKKNVFLGHPSIHHTWHLNIIHFMADNFHRKAMWPDLIANNLQVRMRCEERANVAISARGLKTSWTGWEADYWLLTSTPATTDSRKLSTGTRA